MSRSRHWPSKSYQLDPEKYDTEARLFQPLPSVPNSGWSVGGMGAQEKDAKAQEYGEGVGHVEQLCGKQRVSGGGFTHGLTMET